MNSPQQPDAAGVPAAPSTVPTTTSWSGHARARERRRVAPGSLGGVLDQLVVDARPGVPTRSGHVRVDRRRTARRVGYQHVVDLNASASASARIRVRSGPVGQRLEVVGERLDHQWVDERADMTSPPAGNRRRPARPATTGGRTRPARRGDGGDDDADGHVLDQVDGERRPSLVRQPVVTEPLRPRTANGRVTTRPTTPSPATARKAATPRARASGATRRAPAG